MELAHGRFRDQRGAGPDDAARAAHDGTQYLPSHRIFIVATSVLGLNDGRIRRYQ
jgi:hypothetical protein